MSVTRVVMDFAASIRGLLAAVSPLSSSPSTTRASAKVFAIPELVENIIDHIESPLQLFALRQVNSTFNETINMSKYRQRMFLEPNERLRLYHLTKILGCKGLAKSLYPLEIKVVYIHQTEEANDLVIQVGIDRHWHERMCAVLLECGTLSTQSKYIQMASWRDVSISPGPQLRIRVAMGRHTYWYYPSGQSVKLGRLIKDSLSELEQAVLDGQPIYLQ